MSGIFMNRFWSKASAMFPVNRSAAAGLSSKPSLSIDLPALVGNEAPISTVRREDRSRARILEKLIGRANAGIHNAAHRGKNALSQPLSHERFVEILRCFENDAKYGARVRAFLAMKSSPRPRVLLSQMFRKIGD